MFKQLQKLIKTNINKPICLSTRAASSCVALGMTPGSEKLVLNNALIVNINNSPLTTGITGLTRTARKGQLKQKKIYS